MYCCDRCLTVAYENHKTPQPEQSVSQLRFELGTPEIQVRSITISANLLVESSKYVWCKVQEVTEIWDRLMAKKRLAICQHHFDKNVTVYYKRRLAYSNDQLHKFLCNINWILSEEFSIIRAKYLDMQHSVTNRLNSITAVVTCN